MWRNRRVRKGELVIEGEWEGRRKKKQRKREDRGIELREKRRREIIRGERDREEEER